MVYESCDGRFQTVYEAQAQRQSMSQQNISNSFQFVVLSKQEDLFEYITKENLVKELGGDVERDFPKQQKFYKKYRNKFSDGELFDARVRSPELIESYEGDHSTRADRCISSKKLKAKAKAQSSAE